MWGRDATRRVLAALVTTAALIAPASALAASGDSVLMVKDPRPFGYVATTRFMTPADTISSSFSETTGELSVTASGSLGTRLLKFAAPAGSTLGVGTYTGAQPTFSRDAGHPGMDVESCDPSPGSFEVKDISLSGSTVQRLWIVYKARCDQPPQVKFGEVRIGESGPDGPAQIAPLSIDWPDGDVTGPSAPVPVAVQAAQAMQITNAAVTGPDAADFSIRSDGCTGQSLAAGALCEISVRQDRKSEGAKVASLVLTDSTAHTYTVALKGFSYGGRTRVTGYGDPNDWVTGGQSFYLTPADVIFVLRGTPQYIDFDAEANPPGPSWEGMFGAAAGGSLAPGTTYNATRYPFNGSGAGIAISGNGRGCNTISGTFTIRELAFDSDGNVARASISFIQHCEDSSSSMCGLFEFRATSPDPGSAQAACYPTSSGGGSTSTTAGTPPLVTGTSPAQVQVNLEPPPPAQTTKTTRKLPAGSPCAAAKFKSRAAKVGTARANRITGSDGADRLFGLAGSDLIKGQSGDDCIDGGSGNDRIYGGSGHDVIYCGHGRDIVYVTAGDKTRGCEKKIREHPPRYIKLASAQAR